MTPKQIIIKEETRKEREIQTKKVKEILLRKGSITMKEGNNIGIYRLAARIFDLRAIGFGIGTLIQDDRTAKYFLNSLPKKYVSKFK